MLTTLLGLSGLIVFYFGTYKLIKDTIKIKFFFIPVFINLAIMLLLYIAGLIGVLKPAVWVIGFVGIFYFIIYLFRNKHLLGCDVKNAISQEFGAIKAFFNKKSIGLAILLLIMSASSSFAFLNMTINIWAHDKLLVLMVCGLMTCLIYPVIYIQTDHSLELIRNNRIYRNLSIGVFLVSIVLFGLLMSGNNFLVPKTDTIIIRNMGAENAASDQNEIIFFEVKDKSTGVKLKYEPNDNWVSVNSAENSSGITSIHRDDSLFLNFSDKGPTTYEFLFLETPTSGSVEIDINGKAHRFDLINESANQITIVLSSTYFPADILVLCANFLFLFILLQIVFEYVYLYKVGEEGPFLSKYNKYFFYLFIMIILFLFTRPMRLHVWDEFSHWGVFIKELSIKNKLPIENFCTVVPRYIPGITLFEYFFTSFLGYAEGHAYFAYLFFVVSAIWVVLVDIPQQKIGLKTLYLSAIITALFFLPLYFLSMYVDAALGLLFGVGLIYYLKHRKTSFGRVEMFLIFCGLQLMKTWGLVFSIILVGIILFDKLFFQKHKKDTEKTSHWKQVFFLILCFLGSILIIQVPWNIHLQKNDIKNSFIDGGGVLDSIQNGVRLDLKALFNSWIEITIKGRQDTYLHGALSVLNLSLILLSVGILISYKKKQVIWINLSMFLFFIINIFLLFVTYIVYFSVEEGIKLASYERYASEFFVGWFLLLLYQMSTCLGQGNCSNRSLKLAHISLIAMIAACIPIANKIIQLPPEIYIGRRETLKTILEKYEDIIFDGRHHKIFHIAQNTNGLSHLMLRYELCPNTAQYTAQNEGWSFGEPYPTSVAECDTMPYYVDELYTIITSDYEYVLITKPDAQLWQHYGSIFQGHKLDGDQLFIVEDNQIILVE